MIELDLHHFLTTTLFGPDPPLPSPTVVSFCFNPGPFFRDCYPGHTDYMLGNGFILICYQPRMIAQCDLSYEAICLREYGRWSCDLSIQHTN